MSNTVGQAGPQQTPSFGRGLGLENVPEEPSPDAGANQTSIRTQLRQVDRQQLVGGPFSRLTNWLKNVVREDGNRDRVRAVFEAAGLGPNEYIGIYEPSFGPPMTPTTSSGSGSTDSTDFVPLPPFAQFKRMVRASINWLLQFMMKIVYLLALGFIVLSLVDLYFGPIPGYNLDLLRTRFGHRQTRFPEVQPYNDRYLINRMNSLELRIIQGLPRSTAVQRVADRVDYFSPQNGAVVVPSLTSPLKKRKVRGLKSLFVSEVEFKREIPIVGPFQDLKKKWCAPSRHGKAQITVSLAALMAPGTLVVRQEPHQVALLDPSTYPKELELWVEILNPEARAAIAQRIEELHPGIMQNPVRQFGRQLDQAQSLPETFVPIGRFTYWIGAHATADQRFTVDINISEFNSESTNRAAVRVNSNWGDTDETCVHELKLHGCYMDRPRKYDIVNGEGKLELDGEFEYQ